MVVKVPFEVLYPEIKFPRGGIDPAGRLPEDGNDTVSLAGAFGVKPLGGDGVTLRSCEEKERFQQGGFGQGLFGKGPEGVV